MPLDKPRSPKRNKAQGNFVLGFAFVKILHRKNEMGNELSGNVNFFSNSEVSQSKLLRENGKCIIIVKEKSIANERNVTFDFHQSRIRRCSSD